MTTLKEIELKQKELEKQKLFTVMEKNFAYFKSRTDNKDEVIKTFLMGRDGINWDAVLWFLETKEEEYPTETADLRYILDFYKIKNQTSIPLNEAQFYEEKLKPLGFKISISVNCTLRCVSCNAEEKLYAISLLRSYESGYGGHSYYITHLIETNNLQEYQLFVNSELINDYLRTLDLTLDIIKDRFKELKELKEYSRDNRVKRYPLRHICQNCAEAPNYKRIIKINNLKYLKPEWLKLEVDNSLALNTEEKVIKRLAIEQK